MWLTKTIMAPIRRYLRISKYSVLECRIYLSNPRDERWLDSRISMPHGPNNPSADRTIIERVFSAIRPLILPKLREENVRKVAGKKKAAPVKDVLVEGMLVRHFFILDYPMLTLEQMNLKLLSSSERLVHAIL